MYIKKGPWTVKESKEVYKNPWISVREDEVIRPDGQEGIVGVVTMKSGVTILPVDDEGNVYLAKEYKYALEEEIVEAASGGIEKGEDILEGAKRELKEELGIIAEEWIDAGFIDPFTSLISSRNYIFIAKKLTFAEQELEGTETIKRVKMPFSHAFELAMKSEITHGATVAAILKAQIILHL